MKIKLSKTLAIALALCLTFAGFTAFAANVEIVTSYDYTQAADAQVSVTSKVNDIAHLRRLHNNGHVLVSEYAPAFHTKT